MRTNQMSTKQRLYNIRNNTENKQKSLYQLAKNWIEETCINEKQFNDLSISFIPFPLCCEQKQLLLIDGRIFKQIDNREAMKKIYQYAHKLIDVEDIAKAAYKYKKYQGNKYFNRYKRNRYFFQKFGYSLVKNPIKEIQTGLESFLNDYIKQIHDCAGFFTYMSSWNRFALSAAFYIATCRLCPQEVIDIIGGIISNDDEIHQLLKSDEFWENKTDYKPFYPVYTIPTLPFAKHTFNLSRKYLWDNGKIIGVESEGYPFTCCTEFNESFRMFSEILVQMDQTENWKIFDILSKIYEIFDLSNKNLTFSKITKTIF